MLGRLRQKLVALGIGSVTAIAVGVASAQQQPGEPPRRPGEPAQQDTRFNPQDQSTAGSTEPGTGGAADAGVQQRGVMALDGGTMRGADAGMGRSADGGARMGGDAGMGGAASTGTTTGPDAGT